MSVIVTDTGFAPEDHPAGFVGLDDLTVSDTAGHAIDLANDADLERLVGFLDQVALIRVAFPSFADGRGFSIAVRLRSMGYRGRLRAFGHLLADQYPNARRSGFDEVEISDDLAARQPEPQWLASADWSERSYQARLRRAKEAGGADLDVSKAA